MLVVCYLLCTLDVSYPLCVVCCGLLVARSLLRGCCNSLTVAFCLLFVLCSLLALVCCVMSDVCRSLSAVRCLLCVAVCLLYSRYRLMFIDCVLLPCCVFSFLFFP